MRSVLPSGGSRVVAWPWLVAFLLVAALVPASRAAASVDCQGMTPTVEGSDGPDVLVGTADADVISGGGGADLIFGKGGGDVVCGGDGGDLVVGGDGDDSVEGGDGADLLLGGQGRDFLAGGLGDDELKGGIGGDFLDGGDGTDRLFGGPGFDHCRDGEQLQSCEEEGFTSYGPDDNFAIGLAFAFTPEEFAPFLGVEQTRGVELALLEHDGQVLGLDIALVSADTGCNPDDAQIAAESLLESRPDLVAVLGTSCSGSAQGANGVLAPAGVFMVSPSAAAPLLTDPATGLDLFARTSWNDIIQPEAMAGFATDELGAMKAAVVDDGHSYSVSLADGFADTFTAQGGTVVFRGTAPTFEGTGRDFDELFTAMESFVAGLAVTSPDVIFVPLFLPESPVLTIVARGTPGLEDTEIALTDSSFSDEFIVAGEAAEDVYFVVPDVFSFTETASYQEGLLTPYVEQFAHPPVGPFAATSFDAANLIIAAIDQTGANIAGTAHLSLPAFRAALAATANLAGVTGTITCDPFGDCSPIGTAFFQVQNGEFVPL